MLIVTSALMLALQAPVAWALDPAENVVRRVHEGPFEGRTMLWVRLAPKAKDPSLSPSSFVLVAQFEGKQPRTRPGVALHAETNVRFYPLSVLFTLDSTQLKAIAEFRRSILPGSR